MSGYFQRKVPKDKGPCGCDCAICWDETEDFRDATPPGSEWCPGPCEHTREEIAAYLAAHPTHP